MRFLFCNESDPGRFGPLPSELASDPAHDVMFLSFHPRQEDAASGVIHARLNINRNQARTSPGADVFQAEWEKMFHLGRQALRTFIHIRDSGFLPDMIFASFGSGPSLFLRHAFPDAFIVSYFNGFRGKTDTPDYHLKFQSVMDMQRSLAAGSNLYFVRSDAQKKYFPPVLHSIIHTCPPHVDTDFFSPQPRDLSAFFPEAAISPSVELVTIHMKGTGSSLNYMLSVILGLLIHRPSCLIALTFGRGQTKERWVNACNSLPGHARKRLFFAEGLTSTMYHKLLCSSTIHIFPEPVSPPLQEMLESMSCEALLLTPETEAEKELLRDGETMCDFPESGSDRQLKKIFHILDHIKDVEYIRKNARRAIMEKYRTSVVIPRHFEIITKEYETFRKQGRP